MEQWYRNARQYLKQYRFYHGIVSQPFEDWLGPGKPKRLQQMEQYCQQVTRAIDSIRDERQANLLRNEFIVADGSQRVAYELSGLSKSQYYVIRKQAMREWLQLINQHK
ncbi:hypothetical protein [Lactiplantibacillus plantarum]|uniref:hypothetical protein n=1 Tax=Lactiplantibacillus plantarum TaxID=1590 RepID=UPI0007EAD86A|nr:hypothetical protein [Lactiplantibacillus plantarum]MCG0729192.1 hypothetical protein [Lactiplantibacillus plantarum]MCG0744485.1 hypothetical protein [Lactiplantibacillus plantarum]MCG0885601.1 hypothetical protein [Lactiplantibacillus plantarum]OAZ76083.1 hypothetical protein SRCM101060_00625 [Lactiplantibacillus plantarum]PKX58526.1 hypothetical protein CUR48_09805 [Lactiplantibacillus plantarum]